MADLFGRLLFAATLGTSVPAIAQTNPAPFFDDVTAAKIPGGAVGRSSVGVCWVDFDADGFVDIHASGRLLRNVGGDHFEVVENAPAGSIAIWADFDNDGYPDVVTWQNTTGARLYRNLEGKSFAWVPDAMPKLPISYSLAMCAGDLNGDGLVDLYIAGYEDGLWPPKQVDPDVILLNKGNLTFQIALVRNKGLSTRGITMADYNEDGRLDIYVSNYRLLINQLLANRGKDHFEDVAVQSGTGGDNTQGAYGHTIGSAWGDLDNDGHLDLFVGNFSHPPTYQDRPKFLRNLGPQKGWAFEDLSARAGLKWQESFASPALGDFDNDGLLDLFYSTVYKGDHAVLYRNLGGFRFEDVTPASGIVSQLSYQAAWADFDNDGRLDLLTNNRLYRNVGAKGHWLRVQLVGTANGVSRQAIGAQVCIPLGDKILTRSVETATGQNNQSDIRLHFGLGNRSEPVRIHVTWPDQRREVFESPVDQILRLEQGQGIKE